MVKTHAFVNLYTDFNFEQIEENITKLGNIPKTEFINNFESVPVLFTNLQYSWMDPSHWSIDVSFLSFQF